MTCRDRMIYGQENINHSQKIFRTEGVARQTISVVARDRSRKPPSTIRDNWDFREFNSPRPMQFVPDPVLSRDVVRVIVQQGSRSVCPVIRYLGLVPNTVPPEMFGFMVFHLGRTPTGACNQRTLLRRVLRRVLETAFEKVLRRVLRRCLAVGFNGKKGSEKGS